MKFFLTELAGEDGVVVVGSVELDDDDDDGFVWGVSSSLECTSSFINNEISSLFDVTPPFRKNKSFPSKSLTTVSSINTWLFSISSLL